MGILSRLRESGEDFLARRLQGEARAFTAEIPGRRGPLWQLRLETCAEPGTGGDRLKLRAHLRVCLRRPPLPAPPEEAPPRGLPARVGRWIERGLERGLLRRLATPFLDRELNTWVELTSSNAPLDEGSHALVPQQLQRLGIEPQRGRLLQTWAGQTGGGRPGFAMLSLLQVDKHRLPARMRQALGPRPFQAAAAVVQVIEDA